MDNYEERGSSRIVGGFVHGEVGGVEEQGGENKQCTSQRAIKGLCGHRTGVEGICPQ